MIAQGPTNYIEMLLLLSITLRTDASNFEVAHTICPMDHGKKDSMPMITRPPTFVLTCFVQHERLGVLQRCSIWTFLKEHAKRIMQLCNQTVADLLFSF